MKSIANLIILSLILSTTGCFAIVAGGAAAGAALYNRGQLSTTRNITLDKAYSAADLALQDLGVVIVEKRRDGLSAQFLAQGADDKKINIAMRKLFDDVTEIKIRVGYFGDETKSRLIFNRIEGYITSAGSNLGYSSSLALNR